MAVLNGCDEIRQPESQSIQQKTVWLNTKRFFFFRLSLGIALLRQPETRCAMARRRLADILVNKIAQLL
ncbi:hypothetical protein GCWU000324_02183 [Kingella oralis ATCC 51147]|uniref:Uncharacterized protein n=1 Tax=Kingella oralis ATCC 51147 TaxID=629741 RepID=C4GJG0_9NEIS|nr:hypothetical protein GCWU000324_02183 [Kingella oralis ATCC 51147]